MPLLLSLAVVITWLALAIAFCAIGVKWLRYLTGLEPRWENAYLAVWAGFGLVMAGLLVWHFFLPVSGIALLVFSPAAIVSAIVERDWFLRLLSIRVRPWFLVVLILLTLWTANHALARGGMDDYNYEFQSIRWFHDYRIVPGLANLHGRIGFNNSHHLLAALLSVGPWAGSVNHVFNGFFVVLALTLVLAALHNLAMRRKNSWALPGSLIISPCVGLVLFGIFGPMVSTLKADVSVSAATAVLALLFIEFAHCPVPSKRYLALGATILPVATVLFSVKISAIVFSAIICAVVLIHLLKAAGWHRATVASFVVAVLIVCSVLIRGVILSGYPLYPSTILPANVDWRVPVAQANAERADVTSWAQLRTTYDSPVTGWAWLPNWAHSTILTDNFTIVLPLILSLFCIPLLLARSRGNEQARAPAWCWATLATGCLASLAVWFIEAPSGRFGLIYFWILFAVVFTVAFQQRSRLPGWVFALATAIIIIAVAYVVFDIVGVAHESRLGMFLLLGFSWVWINFAKFAMEKPDRRWVITLCFILLGLCQVGDHLIANLKRDQFAPIGKMLWLPVQTLPEHLTKEPYVARRTRQGFTVYVVCNPQYDTPLPNTRYFDSALELRVPGDLSKGFRNPFSKSTSLYGYSLKIVPGTNGREWITQDLEPRTSGFCAETSGEHESPR